ncbi:hypothetical protein BH11BAC4_BH11BAC4_17630 [soil metagenome]
MNRIILVFALIFISFTMGYAQSFLNKVPANASMVIRYSGDNFSKNLPLKKIDTYNFIRMNLSKALKIDSLTSLQNLGINVAEDTYQYVTTEDSCISFVSLLHLNNIPQFLKLVDANMPAEMKPEKRNGFEFLALSTDTYLGWNNERAILVVTSYQNKDRYNYYENVAVDTSVSAIDEFSDSTVMAPVEEKKIEQKPKERPTVKSKSKKPVPVKNKPAGKAHSPEKPAVKRPANKEPVAKKPVEIIDHEILTDTTTVEVLKSPQVEFDDSVRTAKRQDWYLVQEKKTTAKQKQVADSMITNNFIGTTVSIETEASYKKVVDAGADVSIWINSENLLRQYWAGLYGFSPYSYGGRNFSVKKYDDAFRSGMNMYFEKDKVRIDQRSFSPDEKMTSLGKDLFNSKQSTALAGYVNPDNLAYLSMSINSEAMANYYYRMIRQYMSSYPYISEYSDIVDVYVDLLEIIIDEKAVAELMPGNYMFVLHDMKTKTVTYTDYEWDSDFKYKEIKKTKQELSPNFTFVMETKKDAFMKKIMNLPLKYAEKEKFNYKDKGGYYELVFDSGRYPLTNMYFMVKDGRVVVTTSKASIDMTLNNTAYAVDADTKNSILNNNYSLKVNAKKVFEQISPELTSSESKKVSAWLEENVGDIKMESSIKNGMMQGTTTMKIKGNHSNSLEFFFNMIDAINTIMENDKEEKEKKLN